MYINVLIGTNLCMKQHILMVTIMCSSFHFHYIRGFQSLRLNHKTVTPKHIIGNEDLTHLQAVTLIQ